MGRRSGASPQPDPVQPVTLARAESAAAGFGFQSLANEERLLFPWLDHLMVTAIEGGAEGQAIRHPAVLHSTTHLRNRLDLSLAREVAGVVNDWNRDSLSPTMATRLAGDLDDGGIQLQCHSAMLVGPGLNDEQLATVMSLAVETSVLAVTHLLDHFPQLSTPDTDDAEEGRRRQDTETFLGFSREGQSLPPTLQLRSVYPSPEDSLGGSRVSRDFIGLPGPAPATEPVPVTLGRIDAVLAELGIPNTAMTDDVVIAWINSVLFGFFIDNGPSYLIKAHWNPGLDAEVQWLRVALICNDFNNSAGPTGAKAYVHPDEDGLQVRVEFTVPVVDGLTDDQLDQATAVAVSQLLFAVHTISAETTGTSAVGWPGE